MHKKIILKMLAVLSIILAVFMLPALATAIIFKEHKTVEAFLMSLAILTIPALIVYIFTRKVSVERLSIKDGFLLVSLTWVAISVYASLPFHFSEVFTNWTDSFFEATSGITSTGATVMQNVEIAPKGILMWRSIIHWIGGLGIVMLSVALLSIFGFGGLQLFKAEQGVIDSGKMTPRIAQTAKYLWFIYCGMTVVAFILFRAGNMPVFDALNHALSAISSGGFSTKNDSFIGYSPYLQWVAVGCMFAAGVNFVMYYSFFTGRVKNILINSELKAYIVIITLTALCIALANYFNGIFKDTEENLRHSFFQVVSIISSTGFCSTNYELWPKVTQYLLLVLMFVGGCAGSTSGGFKVTRLVILFKQAIIELKYLVYPRGVFLMRLNGTIIKRDIVYSVFGFLFLYLITITVVAAVVATAEVDLTTAISSAFATVSNIGPGLNLVGPMENYHFYPTYVKNVLSFAMLIGRLEVYTFFVLLTPYFWKRI